MDRRVIGEPILDVRGVSKYYGGLGAVVSVSFSVNGGEILGIVGPNGAGKTTLFDLISGQTRASSGDVLVDGKSVVGASVHSRSHRGVARTFQQPTVASSLTVLENMLLATNFRHKTGAATSDIRSTLEAAYDYLEFVGLGAKSEVTSGTLGVFDTKRLMLGTALALGPRVLLLDEPFGGLSLHEIEATIELINRSRGEGMAIVCIEHVMRALTSLADRVHVMHHGASIFEGSPEAMLADDQVIEVYLGSRHRKAAS
jgi:branched-chain amino acid transport system ATP-binding protein